MSLIESEIEITQQRKIVNIHSGAIHIENKVKLLSRKAWFYLLYKAMHNLLEQEIFIISISELKESIGFNSKNNKYLKQALRELVDTTVEWNIFNKNKESWEVNSLLAGCKIEDGFCEYAFSPFLKKKLTNPEMYIKLDLLLSQKFKSKHTFALYSLALDYLQVKNNYGEKNLTISELRKFLGFEKDEYTRVVDINKDILKKAEREINSNTDMNLSIIPIRTTNRKITGFKLKMSIKEKHLEFYKPKNITEIKTFSNESGLFDLVEPSRKELKDNNSKSNILVKVTNQELKKFYAEHKISITTNTVQNRLKEIQETLQDKFENYLLFLMNYTIQEVKKNNINTLSGFYIGLLKDDSQLDNYIVFFQQQEQKEHSQQVKIKSMIEIELQSQYEKFLSDNFENYLIENIDNLEAQVIKLIKSTVKAGEFISDVLIGKNHKGVIDKTLITDSKPSTKAGILAHLRNYKNELDYKSLSFDNWKAQEVTEKILKEIEDKIIKNI